MEHYYRIQGNEILRFSINSNGTISTVGGYEGASLNSKWTVSERGLNTLELSDKLGRVVAKAQQLLGFEYLVTNYIYDDLDRLRYVIPPEIYKKMGTGSGQISSFTENDNIFLEGMYGYHYDSKGRLTEKHIPGAGWRYSVFDKNYREVLHSDSQDRANNYWQFTKYDALNRPVMTGLINNIGGFSRTQLQNDFDNFTGVTYEERGTSLLGYTNQSFPSSYTPQDGNVRTVLYYDDYLWQTDNLFNFQANNAYHTQGNAKGLVTGTLIRNVETNSFYKYTNYYDYKGRSIQTFVQNHLGGINRTEYQYRFNNEVLAMRIVHQGITEIYYYVYDHVGRKTKFLHSLNGNLKTIAKYQYDAIGRLKQKQMSPSEAIGSNQSGLWSQNGTWQGGSLPTISDQVTINQGHTVTIPSGQTMQAGTLFNQGILQNFGVLQMGTLVGNNVGTLQSVDYSYHIRGGLRGINLDANNNPSLASGRLFSMKLGYEEDNVHFDGNISSQKWLSAVDNLSRLYSYSYDGASRILGASFTGGKPNENYSLENMSYDGNGNITSLWRKGLTQNNTFGYVDKLNYGYGVNSNKLTSVSDAINGNLNTGDFRDGTNSANDYEYWADGSLKKDLNKGISEIQYNYLKLPKKITFSNGQVIDYQYDASGKKLKKMVSNGTTTDYLGNLIYENGVLYHISHDEGRIVNGIYEYNFNDHLGNLRVAFKDSLGIAKITQAQDYDPFGLENWTSKFSNIGKLNNFKYNAKETQIETGFIDLGNRMVNPTIGRMLSVDRFAEKYFSLSSFQFANNNPLRYVDVNGDSLMMFKNGVYVTTVDNGSKKMTGFNQESSVDKEGNETFTGGQYFVFNDIELDKKKVKTDGFKVFSDKEIESVISQSKAENQNVLSRWWHSATESDLGDNRGKGRMDLRKDVKNSFALINGTLYNQPDAGNYLWGYAMRKMGFTATMIRLSSNFNAWWSAKNSNFENSHNPNSIMRWYEDRSWGGDADADQRAIKRGMSDAGSYWNNKVKTIKKLWE